LDIIRAKQIIQTPDLVQVMFRGAPVWLEAVNENTATIQHVDTREREEVPVNLLKEGHRADYNQ